jgi:glutamate/tyrosine decarboxylase-like PLP-dependent enzyme
MFDLVVGASSIYAGSWLEGAGVIHAENQVIAWFSKLLGYPKSARGVFVPGGTQGNLAALVAARHRARAKRTAVGLPEPKRWVILTSAESHSSMTQAAEVMDVDIHFAPVSSDDPMWSKDFSEGDGRLTGRGVEKVIKGLGEGSEAFAIVASAGTTNYGVIDDLVSLANLAEAQGLWLHVDGAYGAAALVAPKYQGLFEGIERSDSMIVDPHKWLFSPFDACMLIYRDSSAAKAAHTQTAGYLDIVNEEQVFNPSDYAIHLSRRARGLPTWFSLAVHGTNAYEKAMEETMVVAKYAAEQVDTIDYLELVREPMLSVVVIRRKGWSAEQYREWSDNLLMQGTAFVTPTTNYGETVTRLAIVNPKTTRANIDLILGSMA